jgi:hypothetical protein
MPLLSGYLKFLILGDKGHVVKLRIRREQHVAYIGEIRRVEI